FDGKGILYKLNNPIISQEKMIYQDSLELSISHPIKTAQIRYTLDGTEPDSISSAIYTQPIFVSSTGKLLAKAYAAEWKGSGSSEAIFMRSGIAPIDFKLINEPNSKYKASGAATLFDLVKAEAPNHGQKWLGYQDDPMIVEVEFDHKANQPKELSISLLYNEGAHIFPPSKITIDGLVNGKWQQLASTIPSASTSALSARSELLNFELASTNYEKLKITLTPLPKLPNWHPNAGSKGWVFVDEMIFNE
ncbi:MAG: chitobiase/beta-hexosaminidase C-terminal domain-containing protein, partial [Algoriphagus sp.]